MPTYAYACLKCGHEFECTQSMKDATLAICPQAACPKKRWGKGKVQRGVGGGAGLIFKGSGFYLTDYRSESYKAGVKIESEATQPKTEAKAETKPAAPPAPAPAAKKD